VGLTRLARLAIVLIDREQDGIAARVRLESYLALTSNTAQFGARVDIYFKALGVEAVGFLGFDVLFHFVPTLSLEAALTAAVALSFNGVMLMGADLALTLTGPDPWHLFGAAHFVFLGLKLSGPVDLTIGEAIDPPPPIEPVKVLDLLVEALQDPRNWQPRVPDGAEGIVMLRIAEGDDTRETRPLMVHPLGSLAVRQCVVPLAVGITRYGNAPVQGENYFDLDVASSGALVEDLTEQFAMGQYQEMRDDEKLAARSFDGGKAGVRFHTNRFASASTLRETASLDYETSSMLAPEPDMAPLATPEAGLALARATDRTSPGADVAQMDHFIALGAAAKAPTRAKGKARYFAATTCQ
jgi:hypothetical protein